MRLCEAKPNDQTDVTALWEACGLTVPWNDPVADFTRAMDIPTSAVLCLRDGAELKATVMVGYDGHRGWVYYLAVRQSARRKGLGRQMMSAAEDWLRERGAPKVQLMVRETNSEVLDFYRSLGYERSDVTVMGKRFPT